MNTEIRKQTSIDKALTFLTLGLLFGAFCSHQASAATTDPNPMCAKFVGITAFLGSDQDSTPLISGNDHKGVYCQTGDVLCGSGGAGFTLTTTYASPSQRKGWIDLKNALQYNTPPVAAKSLPQGNLEMEISWMRPNNADGTCIPDVLGTPLVMAPGTSYLSAFRVRISDGKNYYDLRFGQPYCDAVASPCPVIVTAGDDLNGDGYADVWTIEPSQPEATAILFKGKPQWDAPVTSVIGFFKVPFRLVFAREEFSAILDGIE
jgi:hypothetical protein